MGASGMAVPLMIQAATLDAAGGRRQARLRLRRRLDKAGPSTLLERLMLGIGIIVIFIAVIAILNRIEFGRFD
jgi:hypothetical protein